MSCQLLLLLRCNFPQASAACAAARRRMLPYIPAHMLLLCPVPEVVAAEAHLCHVCILQLQQPPLQAIQLPWPAGLTAAVSGGGATATAGQCLKQR